MHVAAAFFLPRALQLAKRVSEFRARDKTAPPSRRRFSPSGFVFVPRQRICLCLSEVAKRVESLGDCRFHSFF